MIGFITGMTSSGHTVLGLLLNIFTTLSVVSGCTCLPKGDMLLWLRGKLTFVRDAILSVCEA